jgi:hypothetical protein
MRGQRVGKQPDLFQVRQPVVQWAATDRAKLLPLTPSVVAAGGPHGSAEAAGCGRSNLQIIAALGSVRGRELAAIQPTAAFRTPFHPSPRCCVRRARSDSTCSPACLQSRQLPTRRSQITPDRYSNHPRAHNEAAVERDTAAGLSW